MDKTVFSKKLNGKNIIMRDYLLDKMSKHISLGESRFLDVGCGNGRFATLIGPYVSSYIGVDPDDELLMLARSSSPKGVDASYINGTAESIPLKGEFDVIFYAFSWHYIDDFGKAVSEIKMLLSKRGIVVIYDPAKNSDMWASPKLRHGSKNFDEAALSRKLKAVSRGRDNLSVLTTAGFSILEEDVDRGTNHNLWILRFNL